MLNFTSRQERADAAALRFLETGEGLPDAFSDLDPIAPYGDRPLSARERRKRLYVAVSASLAAVAVAGLLSLGFEHSSSQDNQTKDQMELCLGKAVGHPVDLITSPATGLLEQPAAISQEAFATCAQAQQ